MTVDSSEFLKCLHTRWFPPEPWLKTILSQRSVPYGDHVDQQVYRDRRAQWEFITGRWDFKITVITSDFSRVKNYLYFHFCMVLYSFRVLKVIHRSVNHLDR